MLQHWPHYLLEGWSSIGLGKWCHVVSSQSINKVSWVSWVWECFPHCRWERIIDSWLWQLWLPHFQKISSYFRYILRYWPFFDGGVRSHSNPQARIGGGRSGIRGWRTKYIENFHYRKCIKFSQLYRCQHHFHLCWKFDTHCSLSRFWRPLKF